LRRGGGVVGWWGGGGVGHWGVNRNEKKALHVLKIDQLTSRAYSNNQTLRIQQTTKRAYELAGHLCIPANALYTNTSNATIVYLVNLNAVLICSIRFTTLRILSTSYYKTGHQQTITKFIATFKV
jgi:hypothetical protein